MKKIVYVTGNWSKIMSAKNILEPLGIEVDNIKMETTEIQADTVEEVAIHSAKEASDKLRCAVLKNDTGLFIEALNGFPRAFVNFSLDTIGINGILKLMEGKENRKCAFNECLAYHDGKDIHYFYGKHPRKFVK